MTYTHTIKSTQELPGNVLLLTLEPESHKDKFDYEAGQYVTIGFRRRGRKTPVRSFSIVSEPGSDTLQVAMRTRGNFTTAVRDVQPGDVVYVQGPFGDFVINQQYDRNVIMMAGGIGITPFISMLRYATRTSMPIRMTLLYSCRSLAETPFYDELLLLQRRNPQLKVYFFVTGDERFEAPGASVVHSSITEEHLQKLTGGNYSGITYFVCGPKGFAQGMQRTLLHNGVRGDRIVSESFAQSSKIFSGGEGWTPQSITYALSGALVVAGAAGIMMLDLLRAVPKIASANSQSSVSAQTTTPSSDTESGESSTTQTTTTPTTTPSTSSNTATTTPTPTPTYTYRQPVSRQS